MFEQSDTLDPNVEKADFTITLDVKRFRRPNEA
jgi:hypothetical protein